VTNSAITTTPRRQLKWLYSGIAARFHYVGHLLLSLSCLYSPQRSNKNSPRLISGHNSCNDRLIVNFCHKSVYIRTSMSKNHLNIILNLLSSFLCLRILARERELEEWKRSLIEHTFLQPLNRSNFSREIPLWRWCSPGWTMDLRLLPVFRNSSWTGFIIIIYSFI